MRQPFCLRLCIVENGGRRVGSGSSKIPRAKPDSHLRPDAASRWPSQSWRWFEEVPVSGGIVCWTRLLWLVECVIYFLASFIVGRCLLLACEPYWYSFALSLLVNHVSVPQPDHNKWDLSTKTAHAIINKPWRGKFVSESGILKKLWSKLKKCTIFQTNFRSGCGSLCRTGSAEEFSEKEQLLADFAQLFAEKDAQAAEAKDGAKPWKHNHSHCFTAKYPSWLSVDIRDDTMITVYSQPCTLPTREAPWSENRTAAACWFQSKHSRAARQHFVTSSTCRKQQTKFNDWCYKWTQKTRDSVHL